MQVWPTEPAIIAAIISGIVALIGAILSFHIATWELDTQAKEMGRELEAQDKLKRDELEAQAKEKSRELDILVDQLRLAQEGLKQAQLTEILKKQIETFPAFYEIVSVYGRNWEIEGKARDLAWASSFLKVLIENNAKNGVFFSNKLYHWYGELRNFLEEMNKSLATGRKLLLMKFQPLMT